jgi:prephenate dehydrogenase
MKRTLGIIGFGSFGQFMAKHLAAHFDVRAWNRSDKKSAADELGIPYVSLEDASSSDFVILSIPVQNYSELLPQIIPHLNSGSMVIDVASVKIKPVSILLEQLPESVEIIATHPLFGPQSGKDGIAGLKCVVCDVRSARYEKLREFLGGMLGLELLEMSPEQHDEEIAYVQGLSHWVSRALRELKLPDVRLSTPAYEHLLEIERILREDSWELFLTIERENPRTAEIRSELLNKLIDLDRKILDD